MSAARHPGVDVLADAGLISAADARGALRVEDLSRSHAVTRVTPPGGPSVVVKMATAESRARGRSLASELLVYRLATWLEGMAAAVPEPLLIDEGRQVLVLRGEFAAQALGARPADPAAWAWLSGALAAVMAGWHRATEGMAIPGGTCPFALDLVTRTEVALSVIGPAGRGVASELLADPATAAALREVAAGWTPACLVHGDVKWDNCLVEGPAGAPRGLRVIDWELAAYGDPAWDLGCALGEVHVAAALAGHGDATDPAVAEGLRSYGRIRPLDDAMLRRVAPATVARVAQAAIEHADASAPVAAQHGRLVAAARALARDAAERALA